MMSNKQMRLLNRLKDNAFKLKKNGQIPISLYRAIILLNYESNEGDIRALMELSREYTRVARYYTLFPEKDYDCEQELKRLGYL